MTGEKIRSACPYCGVGCGVVLTVKGGRITGIAGDKEHPANRGRLCTKGKTAHLAVSSGGRLGNALMRSRRTDAFVQAGADDAIRAVADRFRQIINRDGPDAIALYVSGQMSMEAQYLANKLAKGFIRTKHIESNSRLCMASAGTGYKLSLGADAPPGSYDDFDQTDLFLVIGANVADCHPILFLRMMDRVAAGAKLIVIDPRRTACAEKADLHLALRPGSDLALLNGLLQRLVEKGAVDQTFIEHWTDGWDVMPAFLADYGSSKVAELTGLDENVILQAADMIASAGEFMTLWTMGLNQSVQGTFNTNAICNLHLATGKIARSGSGPFSLTGQPNAMGGREMGYMGPGLPGQRTALSQDDRRFCENRWNLPAGTIRPESGLGTIGMFDAMRDGEIKAVWIICTNPVASVANRNSVIAALRTAEFVVTQDVFAETETNAYADIVLPGAVSFEADGVMVNSERNMVLTRKAVEPAGEAMPDWLIIARIACAMGYGEAFSYGSAAEIFDEIRSFANPQTGYDISGASHQRLVDGPLQWPIGEGGPARNPIRYRAEDGDLRFATANGKAKFWPRAHIGPAERADDDFPLVLNTGRLQHHWHTMTKTGKVPALAKLCPGPFVEIHPRDAERHGVTADAEVQIVSRHGRAVVPAAIADRVVEGTLFAPFHWSDLFGADLSVNAVTGQATDPLSLQPEFKVTAVSLKPVVSETQTILVERLMTEHPFVALKPELSSMAAALDLGAPTRLDLDPPARQWLAGFFIGLDARRFEGDAPLPSVPDDAPLPAPARLLVEGILAGLFSRKTSGLHVGAHEPEPVLTVLYASQTGAAEMRATQFAAGLAAPGRKVVCHPLNQIAPRSLRGNVVFFASTFGDGEAPDNGATFWEALRGEGAAKMDGINYGVIAFGDSTYRNFCGFGKNLDARMSELGANQLFSRVDCDCGDEDEKVEIAFQALRRILDETNQTGPLPVAAIQRSHRRASNGRLIINQRLSGERSSKEVRQFGLAIDEDFVYEAGDALGILPRNCPALVDEVIDAAGLDRDDVVAVKGVGDLPLAKALAEHFEIARPTPDLLRWWTDVSGSAPLKALLDGDEDILERWLWGRQIADVMTMFPARVDATALTTRLRKLQPRLYSISSSLKAAPGRVDLTVSVVRHSHHERGRKGVASTFLADRALDGDVRLFVQSQAHFRLPQDPGVPVIMIGPGTGVAPFRAFLQERQATGAKGANWLFFGEQNCDGGFYYRNEFEGWTNSGLLTRLDTAFSRDQADKIYVQNRMREKGQEIWRWLQDGAHVYVCGDGNRMAKDVDAALVSIACEHGRLLHEDASAFMRELVAARRYCRDVY